MFDRVCFLLSLPIMIHILHEDQAWILEDPSPLRSLPSEQHLYRSKQGSLCTSSRPLWSYCTSLSKSVEDDRENPFSNLLTYQRTDSPPSLSRADSVWTPHPAPSSEGYRDSTWPPISVQCCVRKTGQWDQLHTLPLPLKRTL